jgi:cellulose synthase/poly-beta-1,6-N-acetylglucosamine synthase-like glycosyltransferase
MDINLQDFIAHFASGTEVMHTFFIAYFVFVNLTYLILVITSLYHVKQQEHFKDVFNLKGLYQSDLFSPISILAPAFNEEVNIIASVEALMQLNYPDYEVIVINDGSTDKTLDTLIEHFKLYKVPRPTKKVLDHKPITGVYLSQRYPNLKVVDKVNGRKADALNAGISVSTKELICSIDADSILDPGVLQKLLKSFIEDEKVVAAGGIVRIANGCEIEDSIVKKVGIPKNYLARIQSVEYLRSFLFGRIGWDYLKSLLIISGAFGVFKRQAVLNVGGYSHDTVGEDMELVVKLHRYYIENNIDYSIRFLPEPVCWTEVPEDWNVLGRQRNRWQRGLADTIWRHKKMLFNPKYGRLGWLAMPYFTIVELLGPVIELVGFIYFFAMILLGNFYSTFTMLFLSCAILLGMILSISAVICEEFTYRKYDTIGDVVTLIKYAFLENLGFRQIHAYWRFMGLIDFVKGNQQWGTMTRKGLSNSARKATKPDRWVNVKKQFKMAGYWSVTILIPLLLGFLVIFTLMELEVYEPLNEFIYRFI